jgi:hypothetical protein
VSIVLQGKSKGCQIPLHFLEQICLLTSDLTSNGWKIAAWCERWLVLENSGGEKKEDIRLVAFFHKAKMVSTVSSVRFNHCEKRKKGFGIRPLWSLENKSVTNTNYYLFLSF